MDLISGRKQNPIEYLVRRKFPAYRAIMATNPLRPTGSFVAREDAAARDKLRNAVEAYKAELEGLSPADLGKLFAAEQAKEKQEQEAEAARQEAARSFNQSAIPADFEHYAKLRFWTNDEGIALCFGRSPKHAHWKAMEDCLQVSDFAQEFAGWREVARRAVGINEIGESNLPGFFLAWAKRIGLPVSAELEACVARQGPIADWKSSYDAAQALIAGLRNECNTLAARVKELEATASAPVQDKPLTERERGSMLRVIRALAEMAKLPDRGAASSVETQLQQLGFAGPAEATIRKLLQEARSLSPD